MSPPLTTPTSSPLKQLTSPPDTRNYRVWGLWEVECYYQSDFDLLVTQTLDDGSVGPPLVLRSGTYYVCERGENQQICSGESAASAEKCITLCTLHPDTQRILRVILYAQSTSGFSLVENAMEIIAIAATGLTL